MSILWWRPLERTVENLLALRYIRHPPLSQKVGGCARVAFTTIQFQPNSIPHNILSASGSRPDVKQASTKGIILNRKKVAKETSYRAQKHIYSLQLANKSIPFPFGFRFHGLSCGHIDLAESGICSLQIALAQTLKCPTSRGTCPAYDRF